VAARYGGEEFVVLLPQTREEQAWKLAQRIRQNIAKSHFSFEGREFKVTASIGITSIKPGALDQTNNYLAEVDKALYLAKRNGRNTVCSSAMVREEECMPN
jgi:diguanylate cyclase (GGDEF)-like protein